MMRYKQVEKLIFELETMPTRTQCNFSEEIALRELYAKQRKKFEMYLPGAKLKAKEIPENCWYKLLLVIILNSQWSNGEIVGIPDEKVWDLNDPMIVKKLKIIKNDINVVGDFYEVPLCNFLYVSKYCHRKI